MTDVLRPLNNDKSAAFAALVIDRNAYDDLTTQQQGELKQLAGTDRGGMIVVMGGLRAETFRTMHAATNALQTEGDKQ